MTAIVNDPSGLMVACSTAIETVVIDLPFAPKVTRNRGKTVKPRITFPSASKNSVCLTSDDVDVDREATWVFGGWNGVRVVDVDHTWPRRRCRIRPAVAL